MKGVLVIDMPPTCWDCPVCSEGYCMADVSIENKDFETSRDARCPLKEMPQKQTGRLIDEDELYKLANNSITKSVDANDIMRFPKVDAVPVIRCKDCKWFVRKEFVCYKLSNNYEPSVYVRPDDFCSMADRRDDETD